VLLFLPFYLTFKGKVIAGHIIKIMKSVNTNVIIRSVTCENNIIRTKTKSNRFLKIKIKYSQKPE